MHSRVAISLLAAVPMAISLSPQPDASPASDRISESGTRLEVLEDFGYPDVVTGNAEALVFTYELDHGELSFLFREDRLIGRTPAQVSSSRRQRYGVRLGMSILDIVEESGLLADDWTLGANELLVMHGNRQLSIHSGVVAHIGRRD